MKGYRERGRWLILTFLPRCGPVLWIISRCPYCSFFRPSHLSSPPSASLWGSKVWETGSKHRSYDSVWARLGEQEEGMQSFKVENNNLSSASEYSLTHSVLMHVHIFLAPTQAFPIYKCLNVIIHFLFEAIAQNVLTFSDKHRTIWSPAVAFVHGTVE